MDEHSERADATDASVISGSVLVAGCGFIITGAAWALFGFLEGDLTATSSAALFFVLAFAHAVTGILILGGRSVSVPVGLTLAVIGLAVAVIQPQFVLIFTNVVILLLLLLARGNVARHSSAD